MIPEEAKHLYDLPVPKDVKVPNVKSCTYCHGPVDKYEHLFQCRNPECKAIGDFITGIMSQVDLKHFGKDSTNQQVINPHLKVGMSVTIGDLNTDVKIWGLITKIDDPIQDENCRRIHLKGHTKASWCYDWEITEAYIGVYCDKKVITECKKDILDFILQNEKGTSKKEVFERFKDIVDCNSLDVFIRELISESKIAWSRRMIGRKIDQVLVNKDHK